MQFFQFPIQSNYQNRLRSVKKDDRSATTGYELMMATVLADWNAV